MTTKEALIGLEMNEYIGKKFNKLTILKYAGKDKQGAKRVEVQCDYEKKTIFTLYLYNVKNGITKSCGCLHKIVNFEMFKKYNKYDLTGEYGIGIDYKGKEFYFDLEDYDKIKDISWTVNRNRVMGSLNDKIILFHKLITNTDKNIIIDHIDRNPTNNKKENLRVVTTSQNNMNKKGHGKMSEFGIKGISWDKFNKK